MGYRYGEHRYGEGLYSRWPDWWHDKLCQGDGWAPQECAPLVSAPPASVAPPWAPTACGPSAWAPPVADKPPWAPTAAPSLRPGPLAAAPKRPAFKLAEP